MTTKAINNRASLSQSVLGIPMKIGDIFFAYSFRHDEFGGLMNPLLMFDHFWMSRDTFGWHPHKGLSAVTYVFDDSKSAHHSSDSMGDNIAIEPGSLHWMVAGSGAQHRERPQGDDALVHALQFFVDLPKEIRFAAPYSVHLDADHVPEVIHDGACVRVVAGEFDGVKSPATLPQPFLLYDIFFRGKKSLNVPLPANWRAWVYVVRREAMLTIDGQVRTLEQYHAVAVNTGSEGQIASIEGSHLAQVVLLAGEIVA